MENFQRCSRCVMDNKSDSTITFDENGFCNYCTSQLKKIGKVYFPNEEGQAILATLVTKIKIDGKGKRYDCLMGLSGGLDSSYLAYLGTKWGLRILAVHIDDGFDTAISKENIRKLVNACKIEMITVKPNSSQFCALTKAYFLAGVPNLAVPQDNILFAYIYRIARKYGIKYFLSGGNFALESILQQGNTYNAYDIVNIFDIHKKFGNEKINQLEFISTLRKTIYHNFGLVKTERPLNYIDYNRDKAFRELKEACGFEYYGSKHLENSLTAFIQLYWFPKKFNVDKRTSHLSSMIVSGQMDRDTAMSILDKPILSHSEEESIVSLIKTKLNISDSEFLQIMNSPSKQHDEYRTEKLLPILRKILKKKAY